MSTQPGTKTFKMFISAEGTFEDLFAQAPTGAFVELGNHRGTDLLSSGDVVFMYDEAGDSFTRFGSQQGVCSLGTHSFDHYGFGEIGLFILRDQSNSQHAPWTSDFFGVLPDGTEEPLGTIVYKDWDAGKTSLLICDENDEFWRITAGGKKVSLGVHKGMSFFNTMGDMPILANADDNSLLGLADDGTEVTFAGCTVDNSQVSSYGMVAQIADEFLRFMPDGTMRSLGVHESQRSECGPFGLVIAKGKRGEPQSFFLVHDDHTEELLGTYDFMDWATCHEGIVGLQSTDDDHVSKVVLVVVKPQRAQPL